MSERLELVYLSSLIAFASIPGGEGEWGEGSEWEEGREGEEGGECRRERGGVREEDGMGYTSFVYHGLGC